MYKDYSLRNAVDTEFNSDMENSIVVAVVYLHLITTFTNTHKTNYIKIKIREFKNTASTECHQINQQ